MNIESTTYEFRGLELPANLKEDIDAYVTTGRPCGDFLRACTDNNLRMACGLARDEDLPVLHVIVAYLYNWNPTGCWGFAGAHDAWVEKHRIQREGFE